MKTRTCFRGITVAQQTVPPQHTDTYTLHTRVHTHTALVIQACFPANQQATDGMQKSEDRWRGYPRWNEPLEEIAEEADATKQGEKLRCFLRGNLRTVPEF